LDQRSQRHAIHFAAAGESIAKRLSKDGDMDISSMSNLLPVSAPAEAAVPKTAAADQRALIPAVKAVNASGVLGEDTELTFAVDRNTGNNLLDSPVLRVYA
jgi:hypothetical protein